MDLNLKLDANKIYHKEFEGKKPGYDALAVDTFLDIVLKDYEAIEEFVKTSNEELESLRKTNRILSDRCNQLESQQLIMNEKFKKISDNEKASLSNIDLLKRISDLEQALYKLGINPSEI